MNKYKRKGSAIFGGFILIGVLFFLTQCMQVISSNQFSYLSSVRTASQAQQYAEIIANTVKLQAIDDIVKNIGGEIDLNNNEKLALNSDSDSTTKYELSAIFGDDDKWKGWQYNVSIADGPSNSTENTDDAIVQKIATVRIFKEGDTLARYSEEVPLSLQGSSNGETIGKIIIWPTANWQNEIKLTGGDPDNYLECNGQTVNSSKYPKLAKIMNYTPNYQGLFLRGLGGNAAAIGQVQSDAIRNITGYVEGTDHSSESGGAFYPKSTSTTTFDGSANHGIIFGFDASRVVPTAVENRPINTAVVYLVRAK